MRTPYLDTEGAHAAARGLEVAAQDAKNALYYIHSRECIDKTKGKWFGVMPEGKLQCSGSLEGACGILMSLPKKDMHEYAIFHRGKRLA